MYMDSTQVKRELSFAEQDWANFLFEREQERKIKAGIHEVVKKQETKEFRIFLVYCMLLERYFNSEFYLFRN
jgi:Txe/YoeB family toxin of Txe-Axe toxin-antitoxin module